MLKKEKKGKASHRTKTEHKYAVLAPLSVVVLIVAVCTRQSAPLWPFCQPVLCLSLPNVIAVITSSKLDILHHFQSLQRQIMEYEEYWLESRETSLTTLFVVTYLHLRSDSSIWTSFCWRFWKKCKMWDLFPALFIIPCILSSLDAVTAAVIFVNIVLFSQFKIQLSCECCSF